MFRRDPPPHRQARRDHRRPDVDAAQISGTSVHQIGSVIFSQVVRTPRKHFRGVFFCNRRPRNSRDTTNRCRCRPPIPYAVHFGTSRPRCARSTSRFPAPSASVKMSSVPPKPKKTDATCPCEETDGEFSGRPIRLFGIFSYICSNISGQCGRSRPRTAPRIENETP